MSVETYQLIMEAACGSAASWHLACRSKKKKKGRSDGVDEEEAHAVLCSPKTDIFLMTWTSLCVRMLHSSPRWYLSYYCIWVIQLNICFFFFFSWKIISRCCCLQQHFIYRNLKDIHTMQMKNDSTYCTVKSHFNSTFSAVYYDL